MIRRANVVDKSTRNRINTEIEALKREKGYREPLTGLQFRVCELPPIHAPAGRGLVHNQIEVLDADRHVLQRNHAFHQIFLPAAV
jgi:hypothetical protein